MRSGGFLVFRSDGLCLFCQSPEFYSQMHSAHTPTSWNHMPDVYTKFMLVRVVRYLYTDKKENKIFLIYKEIQNGAVPKSYMTNGLLIYGEIFAHFLIY
jgi:hypothetical protein